MEDASSGLNSEIKKACAYCLEPMLEGEPYEDGAFQRFHRECLIRGTIGSAAHMLKECTCYGGDREDPPGVSLREGAKLAYDTLVMLNKHTL